MKIKFTLRKVSILLYNLLLGLFFVYVIISLCQYHYEAMQKAAQDDIFGTAFVSFFTYIYYSPFVVFVLLFIVAGNILLNRKCQGVPVRLFWMTWGCAVPGMLSYMFSRLRNDIGLRFDFLPSLFGTDTVLLVGWSLMFVSCNLLIVALLLQRRKKKKLDCQAA